MILIKCLDPTRVQLDLAKPDPICLSSSWVQIELDPSWAQLDLELTKAKPNQT